MRDFKLVQTGRCFQVKYLADQHMPYCCTIIIIITTIIEVCKASTPLLKEFCVCVCVLILFQWSEASRPSTTGDWWSLVLFLLKTIGVSKIIVLSVDSAVHIGIKLLQCIQLGQQQGNAPSPCCTCCHTPKDDQDVSVMFSAATGVRLYLCWTNWVGHLWALAALLTYHIALLLLFGLFVLDCSS